MSKFIVLRVFSTDSFQCKNIVSHPLGHVCLTNQINTYHTVQSLYPHQHTLDQH